MVIDGEAPADALKSHSTVSAKQEKRPFSFIERTWEVKNPTEEEVCIVTVVRKSISLMGFGCLVQKPEAKSKEWRYFAFCMFTNP